VPSCPAHALFSCGEARCFFESLFFFFFLFKVVPVYIWSPGFSPFRPPMLFFKSGQSRRDLQPNSSFPRLQRWPHVQKGTPTFARLNLTSSCGQRYIFPFPQDASCRFGRLFSAASWYLGFSLLSRKLPGTRFPPYLPFGASL